MPRLPVGVVRQVGVEHPHGSDWNMTLMDKGGG